MRRSNYDKFPVTNITGEIWVGIEDIISQLQREIVKKDFILSRVSLDSNTVSFSSSSVSIFACFSATSDSTQDDVSNPDANPLNDIVMCFLRGNKL